MPESQADPQALVLKFVKERAAKGKGLNTVRDICKGVFECDRKSVKAAITALIDDGKLKYWSSGSTSYIALPDFEPGSGDDGV